MVLWGGLLVWLRKCIQDVSDSLHRGWEQGYGESTSLTSLYLKVMFSGRDRESLTAPQLLIHKDYYFTIGPSRSRRYKSHGIKHQRGQSRKGLIEKAVRQRYKGSKSRKFSRHWPWRNPYHHNQSPHWKPSRRRRQPIIAKQPPSGGNREYGQMWVVRRRSWIKTSGDAPGSRNSRWRAQLQELWASQELNDLYWQKDRPRRGQQGERDRAGLLGWGR